MTNNEIKNLAQAFNSKDVNEVKNNGVVFTPRYIAEKIVKNANIDITETVCEPSVGRGVFIFEIIDHLLSKHTVDDVVRFVEKNLYCYDINQSYLDDLKLMILEYFKNLGYLYSVTLNNIQCQDYLTVSNRFYDVVIGNPPYIKIHNIEKNRLTELKSRLRSLRNGNVDMYYAFVEKALGESNRVNFIIPNTFIKNKSGKFLREVLMDRVISIEDFKTKKIWDNISTYTCIISCAATNRYGFIYNGEFINEPMLYRDVWSFNIDEGGDNKLSDLINYCGIGIQTSANKIFLSDVSDDKFVYKEPYKIEKAACKKIIHATTSRHYGEHEYVIYPYDKEGNPYEEAILKEKFLHCYRYLYHNKDILEKRNLNHDFWYAYGRNQGLLREKIGKSIILPLTFLKSRNIHHIEIPQGDECLVLKGILVDTNDLDKFLSIIKSERFLNYLEENNKTLPDKKGSDDVWLTVTANSLKKYRY